MKDKLMHKRNEGKPNLSHIAELNGCSFKPSFKEAVIINDSGGD